MPSDAFLLALVTFISNRGFVNPLKSDNISNFIGAEVELKDALKELNYNKVADPIWMVLCSKFLKDHKFQ